MLGSVCAHVRRPPGACVRVPQLPALVESLNSSSKVGVTELAVDEADVTLEAPDPGKAQARKGAAAAAGSIGTSNRATPAADCFAVETLVQLPLVRR